MIIIGDNFVPFENISFISSIDDIKNTKANSTLIFFYDAELLKYSYENDLSSAVIVTSITEAIYCNSLNAKYIKANSTIIFDYDEKTLEYSYKNNLSSAVVVSSIKEAIYCNSLNVKYIISEKNLACEIQKIADNYMYDSKNLVIIDSNEEFEQTTIAQIDGVIYRELIN